MKKERSWDQECLLIAGDPIEVLKFSQFQEKRMNVSLLIIK